MQRGALLSNSALNTDSSSLTACYPKVSFFTLPNEFDADIIFVLSAVDPSAVAGASKKWCERLNEPRLWIEILMREGGYSAKEAQELASNITLASRVFVSIRKINKIASANPAYAKWLRLHLLPAISNGYHFPPLYLAELKENEAHNLACREYYFIEAMKLGNFQLASYLTAPARGDLQVIVKLSTLYWLAENGNIAAVQWLTASDRGVQRLSSHGLLLAAIKSGNRTLIEWLLDHPEALQSIVGGIVEPLVPNSAAEQAVIDYAILFATLHPSASYDSEDYHPHRHERNFTCHYFQKTYPSPERLITILMPRVKQAIDHHLASLLGERSFAERVDALWPPINLIAFNSFQSQKQLVENLRVVMLGIAALAGKSAALQYVNQQFTQAQIEMKKSELQLKQLRRFADMHGSSSCGFEPSDQNLLVHAYCSGNPAALQWLEANLPARNSFGQFIENINPVFDIRLAWQNYNKRFLIGSLLASRNQHQLQVTLDQIQTQGEIDHFDRRTILAELVKAKAPLSWITNFLTRGRIEIEENGEVEASNFSLLSSDLRGTLETAAIEHQNLAVIEWMFNPEGGNIKFSTDEASSECCTFILSYAISCGYLQGVQYLIEKQKLPLIQDRAFYLLNTSWSLLLVDDTKLQLKLKRFHELFALTAWLSNPKRGDQRIDINALVQALNLDHSIFSEALRQLATFTPKFQRENINFQDEMDDLKRLLALHNKIMQERPRGLAELTAQSNAILGKLTRIAKSISPTNVATADLVIKFPKLWGGFTILDRIKLAFYNQPEIFPTHNDPLAQHIAFTDELANTAHHFYNYLTNTSVSASKNAYTITNFYAQLGVSLLDRGGSLVYAMVIKENSDCFNLHAMLRLCNLQNEILKQLPDSNEFKAAAVHYIQARQKFCLRGSDLVVDSTAIIEEQSYNSACIC